MSARGSAAMAEARTDKRSRCRKPKLNRKEVEHPEQSMDRERLAAPFTGVPCPMYQYPMRVALHEVAVVHHLGLSG